ncbi:TRAP transporter, DctM subunit [Litoreibacter janthinus]|uniref:TRAP transporter, DctM subunit n=2 Tax=Litoreibacter janthinus TaxID=670154 RepID=A0A1I6FRF6_9RHOB|nr:TRAP transporter, DctM subunit [Litoreibacter janthinus]
MRSLLDGLYKTSGFAAAIALIAILGLVIAQMVARWSGQIFPGGAQYAGYAMAATSFLAMAYTFNHNAHIRVALFVSKSGRFRRVVEIWCYTLASLSALFLAWFAVKATLLSARINDISQGQDATPLWMPQTFMAIGAVVFAVAVVDNLARIVFSSYQGVDAVDYGHDWAGYLLSSKASRAIAVGIVLLIVYASMQAMTGFDRDAVALKIGIFLFVMFFLLGSGIWVGLALMGVAYIGMIGFTSRNPGNAMIITVWTSSSSWTLTALPLFIWMGEVLYRTRLSEDMFRGLAPWLARIPGGLLHTNVVGCTVFAAVSGSSAATLTTVGKMSIPELQKRGYPEFMTIGTLAGAATLGLMIPPSLTLIVYGVTVKESITKLFMAGVIPGLVLAAMFMLYIVAWYFLRPAQRPEPEPRMGFIAALKNSTLLIPVIALVVVVIGSMYGGYATPTEAAAFGVVGALVLAALQGSLNRHTFIESLLGATRTSAMIALILMGAAFLSLSMGFTGLPRALAAWIAEFNLSPVALIAALTVFYIVIGMFLDGISAVVLTMAIIEPMIRAAGIDLIWFGIFIVVVVEMAQITPPIGFNLFVLQSMTKHDITYIAKTALPMFGIMVLMVAILVAFPGLATWLPDQLLSQ